MTNQIDAKSDKIEYLLKQNTQMRTVGPEFTEPEKLADKLADVAKACDSSLHEAAALMISRLSTQLSAVQKQAGAALRREVQKIAAPQEGDWIILRVPVGMAASSDQWQSLLSSMELPKGCILLVLPDGYSLEKLATEQRDELKRAIENH